MQKMSLSGNWQFRQAGTTNQWLRASVPGGVHTDLLALGCIPDPFVADHELKVRWVAESDWEYRRTFSIDSALLAEEHVFLVCDGLDTLADVSLNGTYLGHTDNMFRAWEWDVRPLLNADVNEIQIVFASPVRFIAGRQTQLPLQGGGDIPGGPHLRKAPCHWGWDWGPKLPPIGIWKDLRLEGRSQTRLADVHVRQHHQDGQVTLSADLTIEHWQSTEISATLKITAPDGRIQTVEASATGNLQPSTCNLQIQIENPKLWWPNGYGSQPLYKVDVSIIAGDDVLDQRSYKIGLRTIELRQPPDQWGRAFTFYVNGVKLFAKGADWIPADSFPTRVSRESLSVLLRSAADANMNMLRVWGGGYYPEEDFYDLCDEYGLLVWQDFMFACGIYPADAEFFENVRAEAIENVRRLRHRTSLALWCGNNEMEQGWCDWGWNKPNDPVNQGLRDGYDRMFHHLLPDLLAREDPDHAYWPSSASSDTPFDGANAQGRGDCHYWDVWHGRKPFTAYRTQFPRFMSEFGFQALPPLKTIASYAEPADWNMTSYIMEHHQRSAPGNGLMVAQLTDAFRMPCDFPSLVYLSMVLQAEGIRYGVEHWRRHRERVSGTLIWQLNDCWPVASWSSLDYFGRWKALHYAAKRFYAPILLSVEDDSTRMSIHVTSDSTIPWAGSVRWRLEQLDGTLLQRSEQTVIAPALQDTLVAALDFSSQISDENRRHVVFVCELWQEERLISHSVTLFVPNKHLMLTDPMLKVESRVDGTKLLLHVSAQALARFVELSIDGADVVLADNYFDLPANTSICISCPMPENWTEQDSVRVRSLYDTY